MRTVAVIALLASVAACGDDDPADPGPLGVVGPPGAYDEAGDFPQGRCDGSLAVDDIASPRIFHADLAFEGGFRTVVPLRLDGDDPSALDATVEGLAGTAGVGGGHLLARAVFDEFVVAIHACAVDADGNAHGTFVQCDDGGCVVADAVLYPVDRFDDEAEAGLSIVGELGGEAAGFEDLTVNVRHRGTIAYLAGFTDGLRVVDVSDPTAPVEVGRAPASPDDRWNDVKLVDGPDERLYALVASSARGLVVVDVTDPAAPAEVAVASPNRSVHTIAVDGAFAYVTDNNLGGREIYDVADPRTPTLIGAFVAEPTVGPYLHDLYVEDGVAYLSYWGDGLVVVDARGLPDAQPTELGRFDAYDRRTSHSAWLTEAGGRPVLLHGDEDFGSHVRVLDADRDAATFLDEIGAYETRPQVSAHNLMAVGDVGLATYYQDGLRVLDLADPTAPTELGHVSSWRGIDDPSAGRGFYEGAIGVDWDAERGLILLADTERGLLVLEPGEALAARLRP